MVNPSVEEFQFISSCLYGGVGVHVFPGISKEIFNRVWRRRVILFCFVPVLHWWPHVYSDDGSQNDNDFLLKADAEKLRKSRQSLITSLLMRTLEIEEMQRVIGGNTWVWKPNLSSIEIGGGNTCMDVYNTYGGDANYAASQLFASGSEWLVYTCMNWSSSGSDY